MKKMMKVARWELLVCAIALTMFGWLWGNMTADAISYQYEPSVYQLQRGVETMPYRITVRHCSNNEDHAATIELVEFEPERWTLRCTDDY